MDAQRIAIIDLGSNTARLILMNAVPGNAYRLEDEIREKVKAKPGRILIGLGGTIRNLAKIEAARQNYPLNTLHSFRLTQDSISESIRQLTELPLKERRFSVLNMARVYHYQKNHATHVRYLAGRLFNQLSPLHGYDSAEHELLDAAAILHDIGSMINYYDHHKHSQTLIINSGLPGFAPREVALIALLSGAQRAGVDGNGLQSPPHPGKHSRP